MGPYRQRQADHGQAGASVAWRPDLQAMVTVAVVVGAGLGAIGGRVAWASPVAVETVGTVIDFDDYPANISGTGAAPPITDEYADRGVVFPDGVTALRFDGTSYPPLPDLPRSPSNVVTTCYAAEFCSNVITMELTPPVSQLDLHVGYRGGLSAPATLVATAVGVTGQVVDVETTTLPESEEAIPARVPVVVEAPDASIEVVELRWADEERFLSGLVVDDLVSVVVERVARLELLPPAVGIEVVEEEVLQPVTLLNTGTVAAGAVPLPVEGLAELTARTGTVVTIDDPNDCFTQELAPGQSCDFVVRALPDADNVERSAASASVPLRTTAGAPALALVLEVAVSPPQVEPTDEPTTDEPTTEEPTTEEPTTEEPTTEEPTTEEPTTDVPTTEEPTTEEPTTEEPTTDVPTTDVPTTDVPTTDVPTTDVPTTDVPTTDVPTTDEPPVESVVVPGIVPLVRTAVAVLVLVVVGAVLGGLVRRSVTRRARPRRDDVPDADEARAEPVLRLVHDPGRQTVRHGPGGEGPTLVAVLEPGSTRLVATRTARTPGHDHEERTRRVAARKDTP